MTEEDAKMKWCFQCGTNFNSPKESTRCIGSACMAWRWDEGTIHTTDGKAWNRMPGSPAEGYCGLGGKP